MSDKQLKDYLDFWTLNIQNGNKNILYIDIPFCIQKCEFCIFDTNVLSNEIELSNYIEERLIPQIGIMNTIFNRVHPDVVYFGGGTASLLSTEQITRICNSIKCFNAIPIKTFEGHPDTISEEKMSFLLSIGFNYFSLGIQTFDKERLNKINRKYVSPKHIRNLIQLAHSKNVIVSVDLIAYLTEWNVSELPTTVADINILVRQVLPDCITIHMNYKRYHPTDEVKSLFMAVRDILLSTDYYTKTPAVYNLESFDSLGCYTQNIYRGDFCKISKAKAYNCSGPGHFPSNQNVFSVGGYGTRLPYSYVNGRQWYIGGEKNNFKVYEVEFNTLHKAEEFKYKEARE